MTITAYQGRTVDVMAFQDVVGPGKEARLTPSLVTGGGTVCTGIQKLAQRFLLELLTEQGTILHLPERGTRFLPNLRRGIRTELDVFTAFGFAVANAARNLRADETTADPDDERFARAELTSVALLPGHVTLHIRLTSRAGTSRPVILPLALVP